MVQNIGHIKHWIANGYIFPSDEAYFVHTPKNSSLPLLLGCISGGCGIKNNHGTVLGGGLKRKKENEEKSKEEQEEE